MLQTVKRVWIPCVVYWAALFLLWLFLWFSPEEWMILAILAIVLFRSMLWVSPFMLSALVWICGLIKPRRPVKEILLVNAMVLVLNILPFFGTYLLTGGWY